MPTADDLFRATGDAEPHAGAGEKRAQARVHAVPDAPEQDAGPAADKAPAKQKRASGRIRHEEKMTVYVTSAELMEIEQARLHLRGEHQMTVDRGRLVREALHLVLEEFEAHGEDSALVRRLREQ